MIALAHSFLISGNATISRLFADILLHFLISKLGELSGPKSDILLQLFKLGISHVYFFLETLINSTSFFITNKN
jgi:hypothetical protein